MTPAAWYTFCLLLLSLLFVHYRLPVLTITQRTFTNLCGCFLLLPVALVAS